MIGHDDIVAEEVAAAVEVVKGSGCDLGERRISKGATAVVSIEFGFQLEGELAEIGALCVRELLELESPVGLMGMDLMVEEPLIPLPFPFLHDWGGDRVCGAPGDEVGGSCLIPVWQVPVGDRDLL